MVGRRRIDWLHDLRDGEPSRRETSPLGRDSNGVMAVGTAGVFIGGRFQPATLEYWLCPARLVSLPRDSQRAEWSGRLLPFAPHHPLLTGPSTDMRIRHALPVATLIGVLAAFLTACSDHSIATASNASTTVSASSTEELTPTIKRITAPPTTRTTAMAPSAIGDPKASAPTSTSATAPASASDVFTETCTEMGPLFEARAELHASQADQNEFAEAILQQLRQSPEWDGLSSLDQAAAAKAVRAAANGQC